MSPAGEGKMLLLSQPSVVEERGLEVLVVVQEEERLLEVHYLFLVAEVGQALGVLVVERLHHLRANVPVDHAGDGEASEENQLLRGPVWA